MRLDSLLVFALLAGASFVTAPTAATAASGAGLTRSALSAAHGSWRASAQRGGLEATVAGTGILKGELEKRGEVHAIMGPNGREEHLLQGTVGHPSYEVTAAAPLQKDLLSWSRRSAARRVPRVPVLR